MTIFPTFENIPHTNQSILTEYKYIDNLHPEYNSIIYLHKEWKLIRVIKGKLNIQIDSNEYMMMPGNFALIYGSAHHLLILDDCVYESVSFDMNQLFHTIEPAKKYLYSFYNKSFLPRILYSEKENPELYVFVKKLFMISKQNSNLPDFNELTAISCLCCIFTVILENKLYHKNTNTTINISPKINQIAKSIKYIETHYKETIALDTLSDAAHMNSRYFCKIFKEITGKTPVEYILHYRIEQACKLLSTTNLSITDIAFDCGFNDCSYFTRTFKKFKKTTPSKYRNF